MIDLVLKNGLVVDGTRAAPYKADVCIKAGKICDILPCHDGEAKESLDVSGMVVSPGFIDIHTHSDISPLVPYTVESKLCQGVTFELCGSCGISALPSNETHEAVIHDYFARNLEQPMDGLKLKEYSVTDYAEHVAEKGCILNYGAQVGHGTLRLAVMGFENRDPSPQELNQLKDLLDRELSRGAFGMSLGLIYPPSAYSKKEELIELAKVVKKHDAVLTVHMRNESVRLFEAVDEMLEIAEQSGVHLHISHLKLMGTPQWGRAQELLDKLQAARQKGMTITCDQYPFNASSTSIAVLVPGWAHEGGAEAMLGRLEKREGTIIADIEKEMKNRGGPSCVLITGTHGQRPDYEGKTIEELSKAFGLSGVDTVVKVILDCKAQVSCVYFSMSDEDVRVIMRDLAIAIGSDGYSLSYDPAITTSVPHPRNFGSFPAYLQMVIRENLLPLEDAVYKITGLPAEILRMTERGVLKAGNVADITVFDPKTVENKSTYMESRVKPAGIPHVLVGGQFALRDGVTTSVKSGSVILRT